MLCWCRSIWGSSWEEGAPWQSYFKPVVMTHAESGVEIYVPDITQVSREVFPCWKQKVRTVRNQVMRARYADVMVDESICSYQISTCIVFCLLPSCSYPSLTVAKSSSEFRWEYERGDLRLLRSGFPPYPLHGVGNAFTDRMAYAVSMMFT